MLGCSLSSRYLQAPGPPGSRKGPTPNPPSVPGPFSFNPGGESQSPRSQDQRFIAFSASIQSMDFA